MRRNLVAFFSLFVVLVSGVATAGEDNTNHKPADPGPITFGGVPADLAPAWTGGPRAVPNGSKPCDPGTMPLVVGTTDASGGWSHVRQLKLDWDRANAMIAKGGSGKWARAVVTNLKGKAAVWCVPEMIGAENTPPVTEPRVAITERPERIELKGDNTMSSLDSDARFGARIGFGPEFIGRDALLAVDIAFVFHQGWYVMEADASMPFDQEEGYRAIGWTVGIRPIGGWFGAGDVSLALRTGTSSHALVDHADEFRLGIGVAATLRPLWWLDNWAKELVELRAEVLGAQIYHEGDDFGSADWTSWVRLQLGFKLAW